MNAGMAGNGPINCAGLLSAV